MVTDISIPHIAPARYGPERAQEQRADPQPAGENAKPQVPGPSPINPSLKFDPGTGLVIMEFKDTAGEVSSSIPSQRQIEAYRRGGEAPGRASGTGGT